MKILVQYILIINSAVLALLTTAQLHASPMSVNQVHANSQCLQFLSQNSHIKPASFDLKPMNGVLIELSPTESVFALGPYFGGSHQSLLSGLKSKYRFNTAVIRWAGEVLVSVKNQRPMIHQTNERANSLVTQRLRSGGYDDPSESENFLVGFTFERNDFRALQRFLNSRAVQVANDYEHFNRSTSHPNIIPLYPNSPVESMFEFRTEITHLVMVLHTLLNNGPLVGTESRLISALKSFQSYLHDYLRYSLNDDVLAREKIVGALDLIDQALNPKTVGFNFQNLSTDNNIEKYEVQISKLDPSLMRALYQAVLSASNVTLQNVNPGVTYDYKVRR